MKKFAQFTSALTLKSTFTLTLVLSVLCSSFSAYAQSGREDPKSSPTPRKKVRVYPVKVESLLPSEAEFIQDAKISRLKNQVDVSQNLIVASAAGDGVVAYALIKTKRNANLLAKNAALVSEASAVVKKSGLNLGAKVSGGALGGIFTGLIIWQGVRWYQAVEELNRIEHAVSTDLIQKPDMSVSEVASTRDVSAFKNDRSGALPTN